MNSVNVYVVCRRAAVQLTAHEFSVRCYPATESGLREARRYIQSQMRGYWSLYHVSGAARQRVLTDERELE